MTFADMLFMALLILILQMNALIGLLYGQAKGRNPGTSLALGLILGPIGWLVIAGNSRPMVANEQTETVPFSDVPIGASFSLCLDGVPRRKTAAIMPQCEPWYQCRILSLSDEGERS